LVCWQIHIILIFQMHNKNRAKGYGFVKYLSSFGIETGFTSNITICHQKTNTNGK